jgi:hypothetical protein
MPDSLEVYTQRPCRKPEYFVKPAAQKLPRWFANVGTLSGSGSADAVEASFLNPRHIRRREKEQSF